MARRTGTTPWSARRALAGVPPRATYMKVYAFYVHYMQMVYAKCNICIVDAIYAASTAHFAASDNRHGRVTAEQCRSVRVMGAGQAARRLRGAPGRTVPDSGSQAAGPTETQLSIQVPSQVRLRN